MLPEQNVAGGTTPQAIGSAPALSFAEGARPFSHSGAANLNGISPGNRGNIPAPACHLTVLTSGYNGILHGPVLLSPPVPYL